MYTHIHTSAHFSTMNIIENRNLRETHKYKQQKEDEKNCSINECVQELRKLRAHRITFFFLLLLHDPNE